MPGSGDGGEGKGGNGNGRDGGNGGVGMSELVDALRTFRSGERERTGAEQAVIDEHAEIAKELAGPRIASIGPSIEGFEPDGGAPASKVKISGTRLANATSARIGAGRITSFSGIHTDTELEVVVPADATTGEVSVFTPLGVATSEDKFTVGQTAKTSGT
jgi:hypothetical protein